MIDFTALFKISYGLYVVCSGDRTRGNGFISNTVFQVTAEPAKFAACCNKDNYTAEFIRKHQSFSVSVLPVTASSELFGRFGYRSGRDFDKLEGMQVIYGETGTPVVLNESIAWLEFRLVDTVDAGTHLIFIGELVNAAVLDDSADPMTYQYYRQIKKGLSPKNAPTYIDHAKLEKKEVDPDLKKYVCPLCHYTYDEAVEKVKFSDLPEDWICPICGCEKSDFILN
jgi:flavin reductase (DIM6/NTAB) family NADH-FMN oxidoreductase RutF/rubredoxin